MGAWWGENVPVNKVSERDGNDCTLGQYDYPLGEWTYVGVEPKGEPMESERNDGSLCSIQSGPWNVGMVN